jgi:hypothetical protein
MQYKYLFNTTNFWFVRLVSESDIAGFASYRECSHLYNWWQKRDSRLIMIMAIVWILIHIYELIKLGISSYPVIISLNLSLPILLFYCSLKIYLQMKKEEK